MASRTFRSSQKPFNRADVSALGVATLEATRQDKLKTCKVDEGDESAAAQANAELAGYARPPKKRKRQKDCEVEEGRLRKFRKKPPQSYLERLDRVRSQRMFLLDRVRQMSDDGSHEEETFDLAGTTGNIYKVTLSRMPSCTCPDNQKGNQCKHIIYILVNVLKAPENLQYQQAFLSTELAIIFATAPITPQVSTFSIANSSPGNRKPVEGDCPVCVMEFEPHDTVVWCRAACGNNIHKQCFERWAFSKPGQPKCVYCRTPWECDPDNIKSLSMAGERNDEGYVNIADQLGLSGQRDMSTYHQYWVSRQGYRNSSYHGS